MRKLENVNTWACSVIVVFSARQFIQLKDLHKLLNMEKGCGSWGVHLNMCFMNIAPCLNQFFHPSPHITWFKSI